MNRFLKFKQFVNELKSVEGKELIKDLDEYRVYWSNGILSYVDVDHMKMIQGGGNLMVFVVNKKKRFIYNPSTWDDRGEFRFIQRVQSALKDLIRDREIDDNWKFLYNKNEKITKAAFGGNKVSDILKYNANFDQKIPVAFHGTNDYYLEEIKKRGLMPSSLSNTDGNWENGYIEGYSEKNIYLTIDYAQAKGYADKSVDVLKSKGIEAKPIIIQINNLPIENIVTDDDFLTGSQPLLYLLMTGKQPKSNYLSGLRISGQFAWKGIIPKKYIKKIHYG